LYSTVNPFRVRETPQGVIRESTASNQAQWGITHDDDGKLWFQGGSSGLPAYFQFPVHYGDYVVEKNFADGFDIPWGAPVLVSDMQGGMGQIRMPDGSLNRVTGASGNDIFRGDRLPQNLRGKYFYGEPVARIVREISIEEKEGLAILHNVYQEQQSEFIRSTDPLFRPVEMSTAPDGTMYVVDMYHGIIQEGEWTPEGSYIRVKIEQYQLDKVVGLGRVWRLSHKDFKRDKTQPRMYEQSSSELVAHLSHPNGWWRDMAQQVLVQRQDKTVTPALIDVIRTSEKIEPKFHALWVMEGIGTLDASMVKELMKDENPRMRIMAMWVSESLYKSGETSFAQNYIQLMDDKDVHVKMRAMMTARLLKIAGANNKVKKILATDSSDGVQLVGKQAIDPPVVNSFFGRSNPNFNEDEKKMVEAGGKIYSGLCSTCHGVLGNGMPAGQGKLLAPSLIASARVQAHPDYVIKTLLHGLTGDIGKESYAGIMMAPMGSNKDEWIASVASFIRTNFENEGTPVTAADVARVRKETSSQKSAYTFDVLWNSVPQVMTPDNDWKMTASHTGETRKGSTASPKAAFNFEGWTTGVTQKAGMWYQIELPAPAKVSEIQFKSPPIRRGGREGAPPPIQTSPRGFDVETSLDGRHWTKVISNREGTGSMTTIRLEPTEAKFIRMTLTKSEEIIHGERRGQPFDFEVVWTMREVKVYGF
jgi:mono/diheme cytochrome c family protein